MSESAHLIVTEAPSKQTAESKRGTAGSQLTAQRSQPKRYRETFGSNWTYLMWTSGYAVLIAAYIGLRFAWNWYPSDAVKLTLLSQNVYTEGTLTPASGVYPYGYAYSTLNTFLAHATGLPVESLQKYVQPFLIAWLAPISFVAFRSLTGSAPVAALASFLLFLQTEFVFEAVRGSHAKLTWSLALTMLFLLARSFHARRNGARLVKWVLLFYLVTFGLITSSSFFASNYVFGIGFAFLGGLILVRWAGWNGQVGQQLRRLLYTVLACSVLFYLFYFYLYPPALRQIATLKTIGDQVASFVLDVESGGDPYAYVQAVWINGYIYPLLTALNWIVLLLSFVYWMQKTRALFRKSNWPAQSAQRDLLLWLLYTAFASLMAVAVFLDFAGVLSANLQVRVFPNFMVFALPMAAILLERVLTRARRWRPAARRIGGLALALAGMSFSVATLFKVTNEPLVNNFWLFQTSQERRGLAWAGDNLNDTSVWIGFDTRLFLLLPLYDSWQSAELQATGGVVPEQSGNYLLSNPMELLSARLGFPLPSLHGELKIYDNGGAALYHRRPRTPFQR